MATKPAANVRRGRSHLRALLILLALALISSSASGQERRAVKISQTEGGFGGQLSNADWFGTSVVVLGDLDGNGVHDLAVGAPGDDTGGSESGAIWILFLNADGTVEREQKIAPGEGGFEDEFVVAGRLGRSLAPVGDLNGDGYPDLTVTGRAFSGGSSPESGPAWTFFLAPNGRIVGHKRFLSSACVSTVGPIGDHNGDGLEDLIVRSCSDIPWAPLLGGQDRLAIVHLGIDGSEVGATIDTGIPVRPPDPCPGECIVGNCRVAHDLDRDGVEDVACALVDRPGGQASYGGPHRYATVIFHLLDETGKTRWSRELDMRSWGIDFPGGGLSFLNPVIKTSSAGSQLLASLIIGAGTAADYHGMAFRVFLNEGVKLVAVQNLGEWAQDYDASIEDGDYFGSGVAVADLDGNGLEEILVGARGDDDGGTDRGAVWVLFNVPLPPPTVTSSALVGVAQPDLDVRVSSSIYSVQGAEARLHFRRGGDPNFFSGDMTAVDDTTFVFDIPGFVAGRRGIEYFVTATNVDGAETRWPDAGSVSIPVRLPDGLSFAAPSGTEAAGYRLVTFPLDLEISDAASVLEDDLGPHNVKRWRFFQWLPTAFSSGTGSLSEYDARPITIRPGTSYWLLVKDAGVRIGSGPGATVPTAEPFVFPTSYGYHFIANPFAFDLPIDQVTSSSERIVRSARDLESLGLIEMLSYADGEFVPVGDTLKAFEGYALYVGECYDTDLLLCSVNTTGELHFYANREAVPASKPKTVQQQETDWAIRIAAVQGEARDRFNYAAVSASATAEWDPLDPPEPPVIGNYVSVSFPHPEWHRPADRFRQDTRPVPEEGDVWDFEIRSRNTTPVRLTVGGLDGVPPSFEVWLVDEVAGIRQNLRDDSDYSLAGPGEAHPARLTLVVGTEEFVAGRFASTRPVVERAELLPVYPNPFSGSATVRYVLAEASSVSLEVIDVLGRRVRSLLEGRVQPAGYHALVWDSRGTDGAQLAAGLYFLRLRIGDAVLNRSVVLVR